MAFSRKRRGGGEERKSLLEEALEITTGFGGVGIARSFDQTNDQIMHTC